MIMLSTHIAASTTEGHAYLRAAAESSRARTMTRLTLPYLNRSTLSVMLSLVELCRAKTKVLRVQFEYFVSSARRVWQDLPLVCTFCH